MKPLELEAEVFSLLDGDLDAERAEQLETLLLNDPEARETYRNCAYLHSALAARMSGRERVESWNVIPIDRIVALQRKRSVKLSIAAAVAAFLVVGALLWLRMGQSRLPGGYAFEVTPGSQFTVTHPSGRTDHTLDELLPGSRMIMRSGNAECVLEAGVRMLVEAPCDLTVMSGGKLNLVEGTAWFHVPPKAKGFSVNTKELEVVDLGTEFGIASTPNADDEVHVFKGKVSVKSLNPLKGSKILLAGEGVSSDAAGRLHALPPDRSRFLESLPEKLQDLAIYNIQSRWIGDRYLFVDGDKVATGAVKNDNGRWVLIKDANAYLIKNPTLDLYLRLEDGSETVVPTGIMPGDDRGRWLIEPTEDGVAIANKATAKYLSIENLDRPPASSLSKTPSRSHWTSGLWSLTHVGGGPPEDFHDEK